MIPFSTSLFQKTFEKTYGLIPLSLLMKLTREYVFLPFYHTVSDHSLPHIEQLYPIRNTLLFREDLNYFLSQYKPISIQELQAKLHQQKAFTSPSFHVTFDDGLKEMITVVAPLLLERGIPATFFINSAFVDNKDLFFRYKASLLIHHFKHHPPSSALNKVLQALLLSYDISKTSLLQGLLAVSYNNKLVLDDIAKLIAFDFKEYLQTHQPYLSSEDIIELKKMGFSIGAHSIDHPLYKDLNEEEQLRQTKESLKFVCTHFEQDDAYFSFPFSDEGVRKSFFKNIFAPSNPLADLTFGISGLKADSFQYHLHRYPMEGDLRPAQQLVKKEYLYFMLKALINKNHIDRN